MQGNNEIRDKKLFGLAIMVYLGLLFNLGRAILTGLQKPVKGIVNYRYSYMMWF